MKLDELAKNAGTSPRTVRYYVQRGLLPGPAFHGKDTVYSEEHLVRLRAIRKLAEAFFPLDAIAVELEQRPLDQIRAIADGKELPAATYVASTHEPDAAKPLLTTANEEAQLAKHRETSAHARTTLERITIAPGVELTIASDASPDARRIAERILKTIEDREESAR